jgi:hypothetical protein
LDVQVPAAGQTSDAVKLSSSWRKFVLSGCG